MKYMKPILTLRELSRCVIYARAKGEETSPGVCLSEPPTQKQFCRPRKEGGGGPEGEGRRSNGRSRISRSLTSCGQAENFLFCLLQKRQTYLHFCIPPVLMMHTLSYFAGIKSLSPLPPVFSFHTLHLLRARNPVSSFIFFAPFPPTKVKNGSLLLPSFRF